MRRRLFNALAVVSFLLFAAVASMWIRSHIREDVWRGMRGVRRQVPPGWERIPDASSGSDTFALISSRGQIHWISSIHGPYEWVSEWHVLHYSTAASGRWRANNARAGFAIQRASGRLRVEVPYWFLALAFLVLPAVRLRSHLRGRVIDTNASPCPSCGYDVRATPERCPECGTRLTQEVSG